MEESGPKLPEFIDTQDSLTINQKNMDSFHIKSVDAESISYMANLNQRTPQPNGTLDASLPNDVYQFKKYVQKKTDNKKNQSRALTHGNILIPVTRKQNHSYTKTQGSISGKKSNKKFVNMKKGLNQTVITPNQIYHRGGQSLEISPNRFESQEQIQIQNEIATQDTQSKSAMALTGKNIKSFTSKISMGPEKIHESDYNIQKMNYLKETYQQMALFQSEKAKKGSKQNESQFMSYVTLDYPEQTIMEGGCSSVAGGAKQRPFNQTISHLMKNLDLIKNINKQNRLSSNQRRRSYSGQRYKKEMRTPLSPVTPTNKSLDVKNQKRSRQSNLDGSHKAQSLYDSAKHGQMSGYYYDSSSAKIPNFYQRPGPGSYQQDQTIYSENQITTVSKCSRARGQKIGKQDFPNQSYINAIPQHRFSDYSKSQINSAVLIQHNENSKTSKKMMKQIKNLSQINHNFIQKDKKLAILHPVLTQVQKDKKMQSFTKCKRPELFKVKEEHKNPCSYLPKDFTYLDKNCNAKNKTLRDFQKEPEFKSPGPMAYMVDEDPGKVLPKEKRPLTCKKSFIQESVFSKQERKTIFSGNFQFYDYEFEKDCSGAGAKVGPGPASLNLRDHKEEHHPTSNKGSLPLQRRHIGEPKMGHKWIPAPTEYYPQETQNTVNRTNLFRGYQQFANSRRIIDFVKFNGGKEELVQKGLC